MKTICIYFDCVPCIVYVIFGLKYVSRGLFNVNLDIFRPIDFICYKKRSLI